jgi:hypothetical protein
MEASATTYAYRVRLHWRDIDGAIALLRSQAIGKFHATLEGNAPAIECDSYADARALLMAFHAAKLVSL